MENLKNGEETATLDRREKGKQWNFSEVSGQCKGPDVADFHKALQENPPDENPPERKTK